jgi:A/G-specific adenine glycosylase
MSTKTNTKTNRKPNPSSYHKGSEQHLDREIIDRNERLQSVILDWYNHNAREFLWRQTGDNAPNAYMVLVSEVMLQQTQTARVQAKLPQFLAQFPNICFLAAADNAMMIRAWEGMGYNSRALRLRDCARAIVERHGGTVPHSSAELLALPGIGAYTAAAVAAFAYHEDVPVLDVNIRRVYSRFLLPMPTTASLAPEHEISAFAEAIFPKGQASPWHQAVMDIGAEWCTARKPSCNLCPIATLCASCGQMVETAKPKRAEPSFMGTPNRIWRGRVVQILRTLDPAAAHSVMTVELLDEQLFRASLFSEISELPHGTGHTPVWNEANERHEWLSMLLRGLSRDGIVSIGHIEPEEIMPSSELHGTSRALLHSQSTLCLASRQHL